MRLASIRRVIPRKTTRSGDHVAADLPTGQEATLRRFRRFLRKVAWLCIEAGFGLGPHLSRWLERDFA